MPDGGIYLMSTYYLPNTAKVISHGQSCRVPAITSILHAETETQRQVAPNLNFGQQDLKSRL